MSGCTSKRLGFLQIGQSSTSVRISGKTLNRNFRATSKETARAQAGVPVPRRPKQEQEQPKRAGQATPLHDFSVGEWERIGYAGIVVGVGVGGIGGFGCGGGGWGLGFVEGMHVKGRSWLMDIVVLRKD